MISCIFNFFTKQMFLEELQTRGTSNYFFKHLDPKDPPKQTYCGEISLRV